MRRTKFNGKKNGGNGNGDKALAQYRDQLPQDQLHPCEIVLVQEVLTGRSVEDAAVKAGITPEGLGCKARKADGKSILSIERVAEYYRKELMNRATRTRVTNDRILSEMAGKAFYDKADAFHSDGNPKNMLEMPKDVRDSISEIWYETIYAGKGKDRVKTGYITKIRFDDKLPSLQALLKANNPESGPAVQVNNYQQNNYTYNDNRTQVDLSDFSEQELDMAKRLTGAEDNEEVAELIQIEQQVQE